MLRLKSPGHERLLQSPLLEATFGGGEANVAVAIAALGERARFVTALPPGPLGDAVVGELRRQDVSPEGIIRRPGRLGIYFAETGAAQRGSMVVYDRDGSAMSLAEPSEFDWPALLEDAGWFHVSGITPALSPTSAEITRDALKTARGSGIPTSLDLNFRSKLWRYGKRAPEVMRGLMDDVDVAIGNEEDCQMSLGIEAAADVTSGPGATIGHDPTVSRRCEAMALRGCAADRAEASITPQGEPHEDCHRHAARHRGPHSQRHPGPGTGGGDGAAADHHDERTVLQHDGHRRGDL